MGRFLLKRLKIIISFALSGFILYLLFDRVDTSTMIEDLMGINYYVIIISAILGYMAYFSRGVRWAIVLRSMNYRVSSLNAINCVTVGYLTNLALPRVGEFVRCTSMMKVEKVSLDKLIGTVLLERVVDIIMLFIVTLFSLILSFDNIVVFFREVIGTTYIDKGYGYNYIYFFILFILLIVGVYYLIKRTKIYRNIRYFIIGILDGLKSIKHLDNKAGFILHTLLIWIFYFFMTYAVFFASDSTSNLSFVDALFILVVGAIAIIIPIPGGIGVYHSFVMIAMTILGISESQGLLFATVLHTTQTLVAILFGIIALVMLSLSSKSNG